METKCVNSDYSCGSYHKDKHICKEKDDYMIFWSRRKFKRYFEDGIKEDDDIEEYEIENEEIENNKN